VYFFELKPFRKKVKYLIGNDELIRLRELLALNPDKGVLIPKTRGARKIRCRSKSRGTQGGARTIYYWKKDTETIYFIAIYEKSVQSNLTMTAIKTIRLIVEGLKNV
jgi:mRNA-degrading endonuclease RelE of RelBE toxin-antitoxin system